jgi:hypothetical protein
MKTDTETMTIRDLVDECIEFVDSIMGHAVDDAHEVVDMVSRSYANTAIPMEIQVFLVMTTSFIFEYPHLREMTLERTFPVPEDAEQDRLLCMIECHTALWAEASLYARDKIRRAEEFIRDELADRDPVEVDQSLQYLRLAENALDAQLERLPYIPMRGSTV